MCAANQDAKEAVKEIGEIDGLIGVMGEVNSHQVSKNKGDFFNLFLILPTISSCLALRSSVFEF
jgi:hypothetical protein